MRSIRPTGQRRLNTASGLNGSIGALTTPHPLHAQCGVRLARLMLAANSLPYVDSLSRM